MFSSQNRTPFFITIFLIIVGIVSTLLLFQHGNKLGLLFADIISNTIQVWVCVGAFISVAYVISSYRHTNISFTLSQKPHLLLFVAEQEVQISSNNSETVHTTIIHYQNHSNNPFYDLSLSLKISTKNTIVDLSDLFSKNMYMAAHDSRQRNFFTLEELSRHGFDLNSVIKQHQEVILSLAYEYTFNNKKEKINVQEYFWDISRAKPHWSIK
ncbi:MAG: hypothetical protein KF758_09225 [Anaerolineales bacterium]|nr:hypothetical protein [Anaerolineales bacterium]